MTRLRIVLVEGLLGAMFLAFAVLFVYFIVALLEPPLIIDMACAAGALLSALLYIRRAKIALRAIFGSTETTRCSVSVIGGSVYSGQRLLLSNDEQSVILIDARKEYVIEVKDIIYVYDITPYYTIRKSWNAFLRSKRG